MRKLKILECSFHKLVILEENQMNTQIRYEQHPFLTDAARQYAQEVAMRFCKEYRFFPCCVNPLRPDLMLDPEVFADVIKIDDDLRTAYQEIKAVALENIQAAEETSGVKPMTSRSNQQVVECRRYGGGVKISRVYPLTAFIDTAPKTIGEMRQQIFDGSMMYKSDDDVSPKQRRSYEEHADTWASEIWPQLEAVDHLNPENHRCVVMLQPSFNLGNYGKWLCQGILTDWQDYPLATGCLFFSYSKHQRIAGHSTAVFSTIRKDHVMMRHEDKNPPWINYHNSEGYDYKPLFVTIL